MDALIQQIVKELKSHPFTLLAVLGLIGFAVWAGYTHAVETDVDAQLTEVATISEKNAEKIDRVLKLQLGEAIRAQQLQICSLPEGQTRRQLERTLSSLLDEYRSLNGKRPYNLIECDSL